MADDGPAPQVVMTGEDKFKVESFFVIIDAVVCDLNRRIDAYAEIDKRFCFLKAETCPGSPAAMGAIRSVIYDCYAGDLDDDFLNEWVQWRVFIDELVLNEGSSASVQQMLETMKRYSIEIGFSNVHVALRIYLSLPVSNCPVERSFSHLKRIKNAQRSTMDDDRLANLTLLNIESNLIQSVDFNDIIESFAHAKTRRRNL